MKKNITDDLNSFIKKTNVAHQQLSVWFSINNEFVKYQNQWYELEDFEVLLKRNNFRYENFWNIIIPTLQHSWVLSTAKLLDPAYSSMDRKKTKPRICLDYILTLLDDAYLEKNIRDELKNHDTFIKNIQEHRNNFHTHNDKSFALSTIEAGAEKFFEWLENKISEIKIAKNCLQLGNINVKANEEISQRGVEQVFEDISRGRK